MKATFLLGSGISIPAGLPSVTKLTNAILVGELLAIDSNGLVVAEGELAAHFVKEARDSLVEDGKTKIRRILIFLDWLKVQASSRYAEYTERSVNYEDLAYLAGQISDDLGGEYENPALQPFIRNALMDLAGLFPDPATHAVREELRRLAENTVDYIRQVVARRLRQTPSDTSHLQVFAEASKDPLVSEVNLFTLNHDTLLEDYLAESGIKFVDGFRQANTGDGSRRWDASLFENPKTERRVNLFKLHGSVNWWRWEPTHGHLSKNVPRESADRNGRFVGTYRALDSGTPLYECVGEEEGPQILAGTFNKILRYNTGLFFDLHNCFYRALQSCEALIVCGYGFGDKGVNTRIAEWRHLPSHPKLLIIDPASSTKIVGKARGAIQREIAALDPRTAVGPLSPALVVHWQSGLEERIESVGDSVVSWDRIRAFLGDR